MYLTVNGIMIHRAYRFFTNIIRCTYERCQLAENVLRDYRFDRINRWQSKISNQFGISDHYLESEKFLGTRHDHPTTSFVCQRQTDECSNLELGSRFSRSTVSRSMGIKYCTGQSRQYTCILVKPSQRISKKKLICCRCCKIPTYYQQGAYFILNMR